MNIFRSTLILFFCMISVVPAVLADDNVAPSDKSHIATILHHELAGKYTYLKLDEQGKEVWIATMNQFLKGSIAVGEKVEYKGGVPMSNFKSVALNRTFESILFISRIKLLSKSPENVPGHDAYIKEEKQVVKAVPPEKGEIEKANDGMNILDIFTMKEELKGKEVTLRGKVMKINKNILKKNWITLRDGTGVAPDDKIVFTTGKTPQINDIMTIRGVIRTDVNLGGMYNYNVLIEEIDGAK